MFRYGWTITHDYIDDGRTVGAVGPADVEQYWIDGEQVNHDFIEANGDAFRMYDDDDNLYYEGLIVGAYNGLEPLDDFGTPYSGCTTIRYWSPKRKEWRIV